MMTYYTATLIAGTTAPSENPDQEPGGMDKAYF
jgi:hypothetical protein